ncbi:MAG: 3-hydroxyacyl-CoA dehydrogenase NAD-binding domain-containing protein [Pseudomonadota bacterium]
MSTVKTAGICGVGLIGSGWAARFLAHGLDVVAYDPGDGAEEQLYRHIDTAWPSMESLHGRPLERGKLSFTRDIAEMAAAADWIQEAAPEREDLKISAFTQMDAASRPDVIIASSSSGFLPSRLQSECKHPERVIIGHPFNPVYILPLVETVPGDKTTPETLDRAGAFYRSVNMKVLRLKKEIDGYVCDRLQEAMWREALHVMAKDVASAEEVDDSIIYSAGLRLAFMGPFQTFHLAGGEGGIRHFFDQFSIELNPPWTDLQFPPWSDALENRIIDSCEEAYSGTPVAEWEAKRNAVLVDMMKVLEKHGIGAGTAMPKRS